MKKAACRSIFTAVFAALAAFTFAFLFSPQEAYASDVSEMTDVEKVAYYNTNEGQTLYTLINWIASDDYTGDDLSEDEQAELETATDYLDGILNDASGEGWYTRSATDPSMVDLTDEDDAFALESVLLSLDVIDTINSYVTTDDNWVGVDAFTTNFSMLVGSAYTADVSTISANGHVSYYALFASTEGLAWNYSDPTVGWIVEEKELFDEIRDALGYDVSDGEGLTDDEISAIKTECAEQDITYGHYTNLFLYAGLSSGHVIGVGFNYTSKSAKTWSYNTAKGSKYDASYTTDEMRAFIDAFYNYIEDLEESTNYIGLADITLSESEYTYDGSEHKPEITLTLNGNTLVKDTDYTIEYSTDDFIDAATITITITGTGDYTGTITTSYTISRRSFTRSMITWPSGYYDYTGEEIEPEIVVTDDELGTTLVQGTDYGVSYSNNTDIGSNIYALVTGKGNYSGSGHGYYCGTIVDPDTNLANAEITLEYTSAAYTGSKLKPSVTVEINGTELTSGTDYTVSYSNNKAIGTATVKIVGSGDYVNTVYAYFEIYCGHDYEGTVTTAATCISTGVMTYTCSVCGDSYTETIGITDHTYESSVTKAATCTSTGTRTYTCSVCGDSYTETIAKTSHSYVASVTKAATCTTSGVRTYTCSTCGDSYTETIDATGHSYTSKVTAATCTAKGYTTYTCSTCGDSYKGNYTAATGHTYSNNICSSCSALKSSAISSATVTLSGTSFTYNGFAKTPMPTVTINGTKLKKGTDYTVSYSNNTKAGTATATITGTGSYSGTKSVTFTINPISISTSSSAYVSCTLSSTSYTYSGSAKKPSVTLMVKVNGSTNVISSSNYTVTYKNNTKIGKATVTITGKGNFTGTITKTFKINPKKVTVKTAKSSSKKKLTVSWKKSSGSVKYQIAYRKKGSSTWKYKTVSSTTYKKTISSLTSGKTYYVKVRAYKKVSGTTYYGSWSTTKTVKVK